MPTNSGALFNQGASLGADISRNAVANAENRRQFDATLSARRAKARQEQAATLQTKTLEALNAAKTELAEINKNYGPEVARRHAEGVANFFSRPVPVGPNGQTAPLATVLGFDPRTLAGELERSIMTTADPTQTGLNQGATALAAAPAEGQAELAQTEAFLGRPLTEGERLEKSGAAQRPQSPLGQLVYDRDIAAKQFGEDSVQARAFDDAIESGGTAASLSDIRGVRQEYTKLSGPFVTVQDSYGRVTASPDTAAGDTALIFNFMKMLDPGSVVREGEFAMAAAAAGLPDRLIQFAKRVDTGERLTFDQRKDFKNVARQMFQQQLTGQRLLEKTFTELANRQGMDPGKIVLPFIRERLTEFAPEPDQPEESAKTQTLSTDEEVAKLPPGTVFVWGPTGDRMEKD